MLAHSSMTRLQQHAKILKSQVKIEPKRADKYIKSIKYYTQINQNAIKSKAGANRLHVPSLRPWCITSALVCTACM